MQMVYRNECTIDKLTVDMLIWMYANQCLLTVKYWLYYVYIMKVHVNNDYLLDKIIIVIDWFVEGLRTINDRGRHADDRR